jgi:hypothetical protein
VPVSRSRRSLLVCRLGHADSASWVSSQVPVASAVSRSSAGRLRSQDRPAHGVGMASRPLPRVHGMRKDLHGEGQAYGRSAERKRVPHPLGT